MDEFRISIPVTRYYVVTVQAESAAKAIETAESMGYRQIETTGEESEPMIGSPALE